MSPAQAGIADLIDLQPDAVRCPYPIFDANRAETPVRYVPEAEAWIVTRYEDICHIARHPDLFSSAMPTGPVLVRQRDIAIKTVVAEDPDLGANLAKLRGGTRVLLFADPPEHARQRKLVVRAFTPTKVRAHEPMIREVAEQLVDEMAARGHADVVADLGVPLPLMVIARLLGVPGGDLSQFKQWSDDVVKSIGNDTFTTDQVRATVLSQYGLFQYFADVVSDRREHPRDDLISDIVAASIEDAPLSDAEVLNMLLQFLVAGNETTTKLIASATLMLLEHPLLADQLRGEPSLLPKFIDEVLRLEPPIQALYRTANHDTEVGGVPIKAGEHLMLVYASGNRDELAFPDAEALDLGRSGAPHLSFGIGVHHCLGAALARAEGRIAIETMLAKLDDLRPADGVDLAALDYEPSYVIHGPQRLDIAFVPAR